MKDVIDAHHGNLNAAEAACTDLADYNTRTPSISRSKSKIRRNKKGQEDDILKSLQKSVHQSGAILKSLSLPQSQPINENTAFGNYVRDSLLTMNKRKFRKVRSAINRVLTQAMDEDSENEEENPRMLPNTSPPVNTVITSAHLNPSRSEMYQPPPNMWRHKPPQASVWASATPGYVQRYMQQPVQPQQLLPLQQEQNMLPQKSPDLQQPAQQHGSGSLSAVLGPVSQVLNQSPSFSDL